MRLIVVTLVLSLGCTTQKPPTAQPDLATPQRPETDFNPELVAFESGALTLSGFLYRPARR
jgi:hypothetical protein